MATTSYVSACRFVNWLENGQPTGPQDLTTEQGSYPLDGQTIQWAVVNPPWFIRNAGAHWVIPTIDEWYKAAF